MSQESSNQSDEFIGFYIPNTDEEWTPFDAQNSPLQEISEEDILRTVKITLQNPKLQRNSVEMNYKVDEYVQSNPKIGNATATSLSPGMKLLFGVLILSNVSAMALALSNQRSGTVELKLLKTQDELSMTQNQLNKAQESLKSLAAMKDEIVKLRKHRQLGELEGWAVADAHIVVSMPNLTIDVQEANIRSIVHSIAKKTGKNIVLAPEVVGRVSVTMKDVHWKEGLDSIVKTVGPYVVVEEGENLFRVLPRESIERELEITVIQLKYLKGPADREFSLYKNLNAVIEATPIETDTIQYDAETNAFILRATKITSSEIKAAIETLDRHPKATGANSKRKDR